MGNPEVAELRRRINGKFGVILDKEKALDELQRITNSNRASLNGTAELFEKLYKSVKELKLDESKKIFDEIGRRMGPSLLGSWGRAYLGAS